MTEPRTIPQIRARLHELANDLADYATEAEFFAGRVAALALEIDDLADETKRRPPVRQAPIAARRMTPELAREVRELARSNPDLTNREIGRRLGVDGGRVSEVLAGKRGEPEVEVRI